MQSKRNLPLALLLLAIVLVYANSFGNAFHFDDFHAVTDNPAVRSLGNLRRIFTDATAFSVLPANQTYRPVVTASLALDYALGHGYLPFWFHLSSLVWFLVLVLVLFQFSEGIFESAGVVRARELGLVVAAWFGLHPAMAETVNYVIQRGDLYCTLGCVAGLLVYVRFPGQRRLGWYLLPFALAMLSKPPAVVFPLLLLLYVFFFEAEREEGFLRWRRSVLAAVPSALVAGLLLWLQAAMTPRSYAPSILSAAAYRWTQPFVWLRYGAALLLPLHLNVDTDLQPITTVTGAAVAGLLYVLGLVTAIVFCSRRRRLYPIAYGLLWFLLTQIPTSVYALSEVENDHRMFFSFPGLMIAVVWSLWLGLETLCAGLAVRGVRPVLVRRAAGGLCLLALCGYAYGAHRRNAVWHSEASLWADDVAKSPHNGRGLMIYGLTRMNAGDLQGALALFQQALLYTPNYPTLEINLGIVNGLLADSGRPSLTDTAEGHFTRAIALAPGDDLPHAYYGRWLLNHHRDPEAEAELEKAVALNGQREMQRDLLMTAEARAGDPAAARRLAEQTLAAIPGDTAARAVLQGELQSEPAPGVALHINASLTAYRAGHFQESITEAQAALQLDPRSAEAWNNIGAGYGALQQWKPAIAAEEQALQFAPTLQIARNNLDLFRAKEHGANDGAEQGFGGDKRSPGQVQAESQASAYVNESLALSKAGKQRESIAAAQKALALDPASAEAWNNVAAGEESLGRWDEAIAAARQALRLRPDFDLARNNLVWSLQQKALGKRSGAAGTRSTPPER